MDRAQRHRVRAGMQEFLQPTQEEIDLDEMTRMVYQVRAQSRQEYSDEMWERIKQKFPGSVRQCREQAIKELQDC